MRGLSLNILICLVFAWVAVDEVNAAPDKARQQYLENLLSQDCGSCHGITLKGGLGSALLPDNLRHKSDQFLIKTILDGRAGTAMPPWKEFLTQDDADWLVKCLRRACYNN
ncbi:c-type cytochrome [methane-oxidizing endosymbiont of Gigantopelta aegis]|uniref:c-type cytochrome n=1 Tax=methane-oxidizing endosymbiont of Gigantopelta aegis TaxID=2794938 RepID=UPI0018DBF82B|nr:cytochrome c [methane-oxidizing endosymbiont of Gigantopelta aegis]